MSYEKISIKEMVRNINAGKVYLPAIQRKFVWKEQQIINLMDSIMRNYPIGTFLFWNVRKRIVNEKGYSVYSFIKDFHERDCYVNPSGPLPFSVNDEEEYIWNVLDGQQRLTSLFISFQGSVSYKTPWSRRKNDESYPRKEMYFNLYSSTEEDEGDNKFEFAFLTGKQAQQVDGGKLWFRVKDVLQYTSQVDLITKFIIPNGLEKNSDVTTNLCSLFERVTNDKLINYFEVKDDSIDNVLDIFVRVNSAGTVLSKSDLLFSTVVSQWDKARDEIDDLLKKINAVGQKFTFNTDFIMRSCLYILDLPITLKVENFRKESIDSIRENWTNIADTIKNVIGMLDEFGFSSENMVSYLAVLPVIYYCYHHEQISLLSKEELKKYLVVSQLKQIFGAASNSALTKIRDELKKISGDFKLEFLQKLRFVADRSLIVSRTDIYNWFDELEKGPYTFMILSLLYPEMKLGQIWFHQDHVHPYSSFTDDKIASLNLFNESDIDKERADKLQKKCNKLPNLQLLEGSENESKNDTSLVEWLAKGATVKYLPDGVSTELADCEIFWERRREQMSKHLGEVLGINMEADSEEGKYS